MKYKVEHFIAEQSCSMPYYVEADNEEQAIKITAFKAGVRSENFVVTHFTVHEVKPEHYITYDEVTQSLTEDDKKCFQKLWYHSMK